MSGATASPRTNRLIDNNKLTSTRSRSHASIGTGTMAEMAQHLEAAYRDRDLDLLGSLLRPQVPLSGLGSATTAPRSSTGTAGSSTGGTIATVERSGVDRDAVLVGLRVARPAEGARPAPPQRLYQVFTIEGGQVSRGIPLATRTGPAPSPEQLRLRDGTAGPAERRH